jgi:hypothetical protein
MNYKDLFTGSDVQSLAASVQVFHETLKQLNSGWIQHSWEAAVPAEGVLRLNGRGTWLFPFL